MKRLMMKLNIIKWVRENRRILIFLFLLLMAIVGMIHVFGRLFYLAVTVYASWYVVKHRTRWRDWINPLKWGSVLWATFTKFMFPLHIVEQLIIRMYDKECRDCVANGSCHHCGCDMSKVYTPWDWCSKGNWGAMVESEREYKEIRKEFPVEISVNYPREEDVKEWKEKHL